MKLVSLAAAAAVSMLCATSAFAADAPRRVYSAPQQVTSAVPSWAGSYVGLNVGRMSTKGTASASFLGIPAGSASETQSGWGVNAYYGYNWQSGNIVFGPELSLGTGSDMPIMAEGRMKLGYSLGNFLPYVAGGATFARVAIDTPAGGWSENRAGWNVGGGLDYKLSRNWNLRAEYVYTDLGSKGHSLGPLDLDIGLKSHTVRAGVNYRF